MAKKRAKCRVKGNSGEKPRCDGFSVTSCKPSMQGTATRQRPLDRTIMADG